MNKNIILGCTNLIPVQDKRLNYKNKNKFGYSFYLLESLPVILINL